MTFNVTNSKFASFSKLATDFKKMDDKLVDAGGRGERGTEVRARKEGNLIVFYIARRGNFIQRKLEDIFSGRQGKLNAARECVRTMLERHVRPDVRDRLMDNIRDGKNSVCTVHQAVVAARNAELKNS